MNPTFQLACDLIARRSITPLDDNCQTVLIERLKPLGFSCETILSADVTNLWAIKRGSQNDKGYTVVFAGHTDVVPTGPLAQWTSPPFTPTVREGKLFGRGAADMKTSIAAFVVAVEEFVQAHPKHTGNIAFLITSDEEGPATDGTVVVCQQLQARGETLDYCIVGEPSCQHQLGDMIKNGRRGSLSGKLSVKGIQGHIAYPHLCRNPIHEAAPIIAQLVATEWDKGNQFFPPTTWQISNIHAGTGVGNIIPGECVIDFNFRFSTENSAESLKKRVHQVLDEAKLDYQLSWSLSGNPFLTQPGNLSQALVDAVIHETGLTPELSTTGGTSDGRFIAQICPQVVEFGPPNGSIHKIDEHVDVRFIEPLKNIYRKTLENLLIKSASIN
jgi:succinyl-diaminopimelate desuccinylase